MKWPKKKKAYLIFSIVYWLLILAGLILFGLAFGKVPLNNFGILRNYYSSWISDQIYISGTYHIGIGNYFVKFPSSKVYLLNLKLNVTNSDMNVMQVTYGLVYRIAQSEVKNLYQSLSTSYQSRIVATVNSIISNYFVNITQEESRVTVQPSLVNQIIANFGDKMPILKSSIILQAFWLNQIDYIYQEYQYENAYLDTGTHSEAYQSMQIDKLKTNMQVQTLLNLIDTLRRNISLHVDSALKSTAGDSFAILEYEKTKRQTMISNYSKAAQLFEYYIPPRISLT